MRKRKDSVYTSAFIFPSLVHLLERKLSQGQPGFWEAQGGSLGSKPNCFHSARVFDEAASDTQQQQLLWMDRGPSAKEKNNNMVTPLYLEYSMNLWFNMKSASEIFLSHSC